MTTKKIQSLTLAAMLAIGCACGVPEDAVNARVDPSGLGQATSRIGADDTPHPDNRGGERADLPYDVRLPVGTRFKLSDAFLEKGPLPATILSVGGEGTVWRLAELQSDTAFDVDDADCEHEGNRDRGRDRIVVTWLDADGTRESDHLDLRYCDR